MMAAFKTPNPCSAQVPTFRSWRCRLRIVTVGSAGAESIVSLFPQRRLLGRWEACRTVDQRPALSSRALGALGRSTECTITHRMHIKGEAAAGGRSVANVIRCRAANFAKGPGFLAYRRCGRLASEAARWAREGG